MCTQFGGINYINRNLYGLLDCAISSKWHKHFRLPNQEAVCFHSNGLFHRLVKSIFRVSFKYHKITTLIYKCTVFMISYGIFVMIFYSIGTNEPSGISSNLASSTAIQYPSGVFTLHPVKNVQL